MTTRRDFLKQASLLGAGLTFSPFLFKHRMLSQQMTKSKWH